MRIPSPREIDRRFKADIDHAPWRRPAMAGQSPVIPKGNPAQLEAYLRGLAAEAATRHAAILAKITTPAQMNDRARRVRRILRTVQGLAVLPPRTPLVSQITPGPRREGYRIDHVVFASRPGYFVTSNFYRPDGPGPFPAVLLVMGHSQNGKAHPMYQRVATVLALKGLAVLAVDPAGQGERDEYVDIATGRRTVVRACRMHGAAGDPIYLTGANFGAYRLWDCMRSVDYLQSRPDIRGDRIGTAGISGGGWESLWLAAIDPRIKAVNSNCYLTSFGRRMESRWADAEPDPEQDPFGLLDAGIDAADLILACAPRAVSLGVTIFDFFPVDGALAAYGQARRLFDLAGIGDRLAIAVDDAGHSFTPALRRQCYGWMQRWLLDILKPDDSEPAVIEEPERATHCTPTGIVLTSCDGRTTAHLNALVARDQALARTAVRRGRGWRQTAFVRRSLIDLLQFRPVSSAVEAVRGDAVKTGGLLVTPLRIRSDGDLWIDGRLWCNPRHPRTPAVIAVTDTKPGQDPLRDPVCHRLCRSGLTVLDLDPRGMGGEGEVYLDFVPLIESGLTYNAFLLGRHPAGMRVADIMRAVTVLLADEAAGVTGLGFYGRGYGALLGLFAAALDTRIGALVEEAPLASLSSLAWNRAYAWPVRFIVPGILPKIDLEDIRAAVAPRPLLVAGPRDHLDRILGPQGIREEFDVVRKAYHAAHAPAALTVTRSEGAACIERAAALFRTRQPRRLPSARRDASPAGGCGCCGCKNHKS